MNIHQKASEKFGLQGLKGMTFSQKKLNILSFGLLFLLLTAVAGGRLNYSRHCFCIKQSESIAVLKVLFGWMNVDNHHLIWRH